MGNFTRHYPQKLLTISWLVWHSITGIQAQSESTIVYSSEDQCLHYISDFEGNRIPDFSHVGYRLGREPIPSVSVTEVLRPVQGDNTQPIQDAIDRIAVLPLDSNHVRGCLLLSEGTFPIFGTIRIPVDGIVLRGTVDTESDSLLTTLIGMGNTPNQRNLIVIGGNPSASWNREVTNTRTRITNAFLPAGSRTLELEDINQFSTGSKVIVFHPGSQEWLKEIKFGNTGTDEGWSPGEIDILYNRRIEKIFPDQNKVQLDAPIYDHFDISLAQAEIYVWNDQGIVRNCGVENLFIDIETNGPTAEDHIWTAVYLQGVEDCWVWKTEARHFGYAGVNMSTATRITVDSCKAYEPHSLIEGARRYNFAVNRNSNNVLFSNCDASFARHAFISNGASTASGIVFYNCTSKNDLNASEGHRRWSQGLLFDNIKFTSPQTQTILGLYNRGDYGTGHGWGSIHSVAWNVSVEPTKKIIVQKPPGRQNYAIACKGIVTGSGPFAQPTGYIESIDPIEPMSLFLTQIAQYRSFGFAIDPPTRLIISESNSEILRLNWLDISADETGYQIQGSEDGNSFENVAAVPANTTEFIWQIDSLSTSYQYFRVAAIGEACQSAYSNPVSLSLSTGTSFLNPLKNIVVFPNPTSGSFQLETDIPSVWIRVIDGFGKKWIEKSHLQLTDRISMRNIPPGMYVLQVMDIHGQIWNKKILRQ